MARAESYRCVGQTHPDRATYTKKLTKDDGLIDWNKSAIQIEREIRAFAGWPGSRAEIWGKDVIITKAHSMPSHGKPGTIEATKSSGNITIYAKDGAICIEKLKPAGKKEITAKEFISGYYKQ